MATTHAEGFQRQGVDAYAALRAGAKRAAQENARNGGMDQFRKEGEHRAPVRTEPAPRPTLTAREYLNKFGAK